MIGGTQAGNVTTRSASRHALLTAMAFGVMLSSGCDTVSPDGIPTGDKQAVVAAAIRAAEIVGRSVAAIRPAKDLQAIFESGQSPPVCPDLVTELDGNDILLTLDYSSGCAPPPYPITFGGSVAGTSFIAFDAFDYTLTDLVVDGESFGGTIAGSFVVSASGATFTVNVDLTLDDGTSVRGTATVEVEDASGILRFTADAVIATTMSDQSISITFNGLVVDAVSHVNFIPEAGTANFVMPATNPDTTGTTVTIEFTSQTPGSGAVLEQAD